MVLPFHVREFHSQSFMGINASEVDYAIKSSPMVSDTLAVNLSCMDLSATKVVGEMLL